ncbi:MAG: phosphoadenylyl-sulfate reductase [Proteobacteria bacterium]|nr:phosphoadenylyl-sulfate reductase [Pseudomonadota bacterium]
MESDIQTMQASPECDSPHCSIDRCTFSGPANLNRWNRHFARLSAPARVESALRHLPGPHVLSSSFGAQAAVSLHMLTRQQPDIPVILADTGYLFAETYQFIDDLTRRLNLNLHVVRSTKSPAWQEQLYGQRWLQGVEGIDAYNFDNKVEPMQRALNDLGVATWFSGLRRSQGLSRAETPFVHYAGERFKVCPIADWSDRDVYDYLKANDLPYHPLWERGYVSIGDVHTTRALHEVDDESETRFFGLKRECGLHDRVL